MPPSHNIIGYEIEMIVIRNVPAKTSLSEEYVGPMLSWLRETVLVACTSRRHQRVSIYL